jgi:hypothetical protein
MKFRAASLGFVALVVPAAAGAQSLPPIKASSGNAVPECVTPGRLTAYLKARNAALDRRFAGVATEYMRHGTDLGLRWDYAFFQMIVETGNLSYQRGNGKPGDVKPSQNNFAGLGATGRGAPGEAFPDVPTGVKAHLQHVLMYSGDRVDDAVAERTRKVQEWGVLTSWQKTFKAPITFTDLTRKWAPTDRSYATTIAAVAKRFNEEFCNRPDPQPELVQEAMGKTVRSAAAKGATSKAVAAKVEDDASSSKVSGLDLAKRAREIARSEGMGDRASLGAGSLAVAGGVSTVQQPVAKADAEAQQPFTKATVASALPYTVLNLPKSDEQQPGGAAAATVQTASAAGNLKQVAPVPVPPKCRVWTASYGGLKSVIIKSSSDQHVNYTVLDVNEGSEKRETESYIAAYAKGGQKIADFADQTQALDRAFELCPEG